MSSQSHTTIPPFFVNSIPKSGTHLMKPLLQGVPALTHHAFIFPGHPNQVTDHMNKLSSMKTNEFANGHIFYNPEYKTLFQLLKLKQVFQYRGRGISSFLTLTFS